jgi:sugar/nucleoside kinase (ribokinase family)
VLYLEGYLWDPEEPRAAMRKAITAARAAGTQVAFTLSDAFVISRHGDDFRALIADGLIDILFANEHELAALTGRPISTRHGPALRAGAHRSSPAAKGRPCAPCGRMPMSRLNHRRGRHDRRG